MDYGSIFRREAVYASLVELVLNSLLSIPSMPSVPFFRSSQHCNAHHPSHPFTSSFYRRRASIPRLHPVRAVISSFDHCMMPTVSGKKEGISSLRVIFHGTIILPDIFSFPHPNTPPQPPNPAITATHRHPFQPLNTPTHTPTPTSSTTIPLRDIIPIAPTRADAQTHTPLAIM